MKEIGWSLRMGLPLLKGLKLTSRAICELGQICIVLITLILYGLFDLDGE